MKTNLSPKIFMFSGFIILVIMSCSKKDNNMNPAGTPPVTQTPSPIGVILDSGIVNTNTRVMKMALGRENFTLYNSNELVSYAAATVKVAFYVNNDGSIPSGDYNFSSSDEKAPFTFDSAVLEYIPGGDASVSESDPITDGTITVSYQGNIYLFALKVNLASGLTTSQIYSGPLSYSDK